MAIDWALIEEFEGKGIRNGYVPNPESSQSGVTIATGVDLGARSAGDIDRLGIPDTLKIKLRPYAGLKKQEAAAFLLANPLSLTEIEVGALDRAIREEAVARLRADYDGAVQAGAFDTLPDAAQTIITSVAFQYGSLPRRTPTFWRLATARDWDGVIAELENFGDSYHSRRGKEAAHLREGLSRPA